MHLQRLPPRVVAREYRAPVMFAQRPEGRQPLKSRLLVLCTLALLTSFVPYTWDLEDRPAWYKDGLTTEELLERRALHKMNAFIGGDIEKIEDLWHE